MTRLAPGLWAEVRALYESGDVRVHDIALRFGISDRGLLLRARREGWTRRKDIPRRSFAGSKADIPVSSGHPTRRVRDALIRRLYKAIDIKLKHWEDRMKRGDDLTPADSERMAKEITTMINGFETVAETEGALEKRDAEPAVAAAARRRAGTRGGDGTPSEASTDAERMRREIAERLERLRHGGSGGGAG